MSDPNDTPVQLHWRQLQATAEPRELFRYERRGETLVYRLRLSGDGGYEVSVSEITAPGNESSTGAIRFTHADTYMAFLHDAEKNLVRDGWTAGISPTA